MSGSSFPNSTSDIVLSRTSRVLADNGTQGGDASLEEVFRQMTLGDIFPRLMEANTVVENVPATTTAYAFVAGDKNKTKNFLSSAACVVSVPPNMPIGYVVGWIQGGDGILTFQSASGAGQSVLSPDGLRSGGKYGRGTLELVATNTWLLSGFTQV